MFGWLQRLLQPREQLPSLSDWEKNCPDCETENGKLHDLYCTKERCPFCHGQLISCGCLPEVLKLNERERQCLDEYIDDSIEPLKGIMERWEGALNEKGRVPFVSRPLTIDADGLILAAGRGEMPFVKRLLAEGVAVDAVNEVNHTALMTAASTGQIDILRFLIKAGANVNHRNQHLWSPLHCAVNSPMSTFQKYEQAKLACVEELINHGADLNALNDFGSTPLMNAAWFGRFPAVIHLIEKGASTTFSDKKGRTAEILARERQHVEIADFLAK